MNGRRRLMIAGAGLLALHPVFAQQAGRIYRVGILSIGTDPKSPGRWPPFFQAMAGFNYVEDRNVVFTRAYGDGKFENLPGLIDQLVAAKVDIIVAIGNRQIIGLKKAGVSIPTVMTFVDDPVAAGFVESLARPGANLIGLTNLIPGLGKKYVELLRECVPSAKHFAVVASPPAPTPHMRREFEAAAKAFGMRQSIAHVRSPDEYDSVLAGAKKSGAGGLIATMDGETFRHRHQLVGLALKHRLPGVYGDVGYVEEGGLMNYSASFADRLRQAATYVDKILRGAKPAELPIEQPKRIELVINMKTARALSVTVPQSLLLRADRTIQ